MKINKDIQLLRGWSIQNQSFKDIKQVDNIDNKNLKLQIQGNYQYQKIVAKTSSTDRLYNKKQEKSSITRRNINPEIRIRKKKVPSQSKQKIQNNKLYLNAGKKQKIMMIKQECSFDQIISIKQKQDLKQIITQQQFEHQTKQFVLERVVKSQNSGQINKNQIKQQKKPQLINPKNNTKYNTTYNIFNKKDPLKPLLTNKWKSQKNLMRLSQLNFTKNNTPFIFQAIKQPSKMDNDNVIKSLKYQKKSQNQTNSRNTIDQYLRSTFIKNDYTDISKYKFHQSKPNIFKSQQIRTQQDVYNGYKHIFNVKLNDKTMIKYPSRYKIVQS